MILVSMLINQAHPWKDYHYAAIAFKVRAADLLSRLRSCCSNAHGQ